MPDERTEQGLAQAFIAAYNALCKEHGFIIVAEPAWRQSLDTGDWRLTIALKTQRVAKT